MAVDKDQPPSVNFPGFSISEEFHRLRYPGLRREESIVLRAYLDDVGTQGLKRVRTSWPVGEGEQAVGSKEPFKSQARANSQWKIDAVLDWSGRTEVIEIKSRATHTAIGQVSAYSFAIGQEPNEQTNPKRTVAAFRAHPDLPTFARATGTNLHLLPDADPSTATSRSGSLPDGRL